MTAQFHGSNTAATSSTLTSPNSAPLAPDFEAATARAGNTKRSGNTSKSVRFKDHDSRSASPDPNRAALFPYRDDPESGGYHDEDESPDHTDLSNQQIHDYHRQVMQDQDDQLDALSTSIGRQRELSLAIGDELDEQALMLGDVEDATDRHQGQLNRAQGRLEKVYRKARENWGMTTIIILIIILVLLIIILK
jgi:syntaxin 8